MDPLVSILIPAYNAERWLADSLRSAIQQTWVRKEIIVVDDGSRDGTLEVARTFAAPNVKVVTQKNQGAAGARNTALSHSQGDHIQWLDADDLLAPDKVARQMSAIQDDPDAGTLLSSAWGRFISRPRRAGFVPTALWGDLTPTEWLLRKLEQNLHMQTATWLVSRQATEAAGPWNTGLLGDDDGEYFCRVLLNSDRIRFVPESRVYYRMAPDSLSYIGHSESKMRAQFRSMQLTIGYLRSMDDSPRARAACVTYLQNWLPNFYPERPEIVAQAQALAGELGGRLETPRLSWKYSWIDGLFGRRVAKRAQVLLPRARWALARHWDSALARVEGAQKRAMPPAGARL